MDMRFLLLLRSELKLFLTTVPIHIVVTIQPTVMFLLMSIILVHPTFDMYVLTPTSPQGRALVQAMYEVGSPIGEPYINPILIDDASSEVQVIRIEERDETPTAVQSFGLIDSNLVKNLRNRLTAAALNLWNEQMGSGAVTVEEHPWLPRDVPYPTYFGLAMLPVTIVLSTAILGGTLIAQDFEFKTITEYRLAPVSLALILGARLARLVLTGLVGVVLLSAAIGLTTGAWPNRFWLGLLILLPVGLIAACLGTMAGLLLRRTIPSFVVGLTFTFGTWILGSGFGLAAGFGGLYEAISRCIPNTHAIELLFPQYYGVQVGRSLYSILFLVGASVMMVGLTAIVYRQRVMRRE
jgi:hypothetical protein